MAEASLPLYAQIANDLRTHIRNGVYITGEKLPSEANLSQRFGVNRHTLRRAVELLKTEGFLRSEQGRGVFVSASPIRIPIGKRVRYNETLKAQGLKRTVKVVHSGQLPAEKAVAEALELPSGSPVGLIQRLVIADDQPISINNSYLPLQRLPDLLSHRDRMQSISHLLQEVYQFDHIRRSTLVSARTVRRQDARLLEVPLNAPILLAESINENQHGQVIEYGVTRFRGDHMELYFTDR